MMEDEQFEELFKAVHEEDAWEISEERIKAILTELLCGEFQDLQERRFVVRITKLKPGRNAQVYRWANPVVIKLNSERMRPTEHDIRETLRHELLHVLLNAGDEDPLFKIEAKRRNIKLNHPDAMWWK
jgi:hypothetical protein